MTSAPGQDGRLGRSLAVTALAVVASMLLAAPAMAGLTAGRTCMDFITGDSLRKLSVCARGYVSADGRTTNSVVEMHTYRWVGAPTSGWLDSVSQSITVNWAVLHPGPFDFGNDHPNLVGPTCIVNGPTPGRFACSVPNTSRVAFYSLSAPRGSDVKTTQIWMVSWRDDRGQAHIVNQTSNPFPGSIPVDFNWR